MLTEKTCLVLGAGASLDSGLPDGKKLMCLLAQCANHGADHNDFIVCQWIMEKTKIDVSKLRGVLLAFAHQLQYSFAPSLDEFIAANKAEYYEDIAKLAILWVIGRCEIKELVFKWDRPLTEKHLKFPVQNWSQDLWWKIIGGCDSLDLFQKSLSNLTILTFNYDRSLEYFLHQCAKNYFGSEQEIDRIFKENFYIGHVYGQIGYLEWQSNEKDLVRTYDYQLTSITAASAIKIADSIRTFNEIKTYDRMVGIVKNLNEIANRFTTADTLHFLGFGYHDQNMRLFSSEFINPPVSDQLKMGGTVFKLSESNKTKATAHLHKWAGNVKKMNFIDQEISEYIKAYF